MKNENLLDIVNEVTQKLKVPILSEAGVIYTHWLPSNPNKILDKQRGPSFRYKNIGLWNTVINLHGTRMEKS